MRKFTLIAAAALLIPGAASAQLLGGQAGGGLTGGVTGAWAARRAGSQAA